MNGNDDLRWSRWARKVCTLLLWCIWGGVGLLVLALVVHLSPDWFGLKKHFSFGAEVRWYGSVFKFSGITDPAGLRLAYASVLPLLGGWLIGSLLFLYRLRDLVSVIAQTGRFHQRAERDLAFLGNILLAASMALPLCLGLISWTIFQYDRSAGWSVQGLPDLVLLLCGLLFRTLAGLFSLGFRLQSEADQTV